MEVFAHFGTAEHKEKYLKPLLDGTIRSGFAMTEPSVASSDATNVQLSMVRDGDEYVLNGRKWFTSNGMHKNCRVLIVMGKTDPNAAPHRQQSMMVVPIDAPATNTVSAETISARLGPGRIHHCMRTIGAAERALELLCTRARSRATFGKTISENANIQDWIAEARIDIEMFACSPSRRLI